MTNVTKKTKRRHDDPDAVLGVTRTRAAQRLGARLRRPLFAWWDVHARALPWRDARTSPWGVLVCEIMSQQTQMGRVVPYWNAWMERWPDAAALADAPRADVLAAWGRLGYPRRALRLQECARVVAAECRDELPRDYDALVALPGVGDYTASAVLSFAYGERIAVIDTNIRRVLSRAFLGEESLGGATGAAERALANAVLPRDAAASATWNQAVMELGALVCTAKQPACADCPLHGGCLFLAAGLPHLGERRTRPRQRFAGTDRQVRGIIMQALRDLPEDAHGVLRHEDASRLWKDTAQLDRCIASLDDDGLVESVSGHDVRLPA